MLPFLRVAIVGSDRGPNGESGLAEIGIFLFLLVAIGICISGMASARRLGPGGVLGTRQVLMIPGSA